jgi:HAD superfamily hydrolase (TIGR01490 family)
MPRLVIFDLDRTLSPVNVSFAFGRYLYKAGVIPFYSMSLLVAAYFLHKSGLIKVDKLHKIAFRLIFSQRAQVSIQKMVEAFLAEARDWLFRPSLLALLAKEKAQNAQIWLQSSSPECLVLPIAEILGISCVQASRYFVDHHGRYQKVAEVVNGERKRKFLDQFLEKNLVSREEVTAYSDSMLDLPLLEGVGSPIAVHPEKRLEKIARARNWSIWSE